MKKFLAFVDLKRFSKGQRKEVAPLALIYLAREWSGLTTKELGRVDEYPVVHSVPGTSE